MPTHEKPKSWWAIIKQTLMEWSEDRASTLAAALSYTAIFSLAPLAVIAVFVAGLVLGHHSGARAAIHEQVAQFVGPNAAGFLDTVIQKTYEASIGGKAVLVSIVSAVLLIYAATNLFVTLQDSLNVIWHVERDPKSGWGAMIWDRLLTFFMVLVIGVLLLGSVVLATYLTAATNLLGGLHPVLPRMGEAVISAGVFTGLFALIMKYLPDARVKWRDVLMGATVTAVLFTIGKYLLGLYLTRASVSSSYGAAGSLVVVMLFIYYSALIFFLGAKFTSVYARRTGTPIQPGKHAVCVEDLRAEREEKKVAAGLKEKEPEYFTPAAERESGMTIKSKPVLLGLRNPPERFNVPGVRPRGRKMVKAD